MVVRMWAEWKGEDVGPDCRVERGGFERELAVVRRREREQLCELRSHYVGQLD